MMKAGHDVIRILGVGALGAAALLAGCAAPGPSGSATGAATTGTVASETTVANVRRVGFLTDYARLQPMPGGGGMLCWRNPEPNWKRFDKVMFERIQVYLKPGSTQSVDPTDLKMLIDYFHSDLGKAIQPEAQIVTAPGPDVLRVGIALTDLVPTNTVASLAGTAVPYEDKSRPPRRWGTRLNRQEAGFGNSRNDDQLLLADAD